MLSRRNTLLFLLAFSFLGGCTVETSKNGNTSSPASQAANANVANQIKDDTDEFEMLVALPFHPDEVVWREDDFPANGASPNAVKKITAVIRLKKEDSAKVVAQAEKLRPPTPEVLTPERWFPAELIAQSQVSGDDTLKGTSYGANDFFTGPYTDGKLIRVNETDYFLLELFAK